MKRFIFPLERALHLRRMNLEVEQLKLQQLNAEVIRLKGSVLALQSFSTETREWISGNVSAGAAFSTVPEFQQRTRQHVSTLKRKTVEVQAQADVQKAKAVEARTKVKLLETLRASRHAEWLAESNREQENFASDAYLSRWCTTTAQDRKQ